MNESVGYTVTINIVITFIVIVFVFISNAIIYYKSNKVGNLITDSIEKYSGFNQLSKNEIDQRLLSVGYNKKKINCAASINEKGSKTCSLVTKISDIDIDTSKDGYCVYLCDSEEDYYYYKVKSNMIINIPIINNIINGTIYSSTGNIFNFSNVDTSESEYSVLRGDVNGDTRVDNDDLVLLKQYLSNPDNRDEQFLKNADVSNDGQVSNIDVACLINMFNGKPCTRALGDVNLNGVIDNADAETINKYATDKVELVLDSKQNADFNGDAVVDVLDSVAVSKFLANYNNDGDV